MVHDHACAEYAIRVVSTQQMRCVSIRQVANVIAWNVMHSLLPSSQHYTVSFLIAPRLPNEQCKPRRAG